MIRLGLGARAHAAHHLRAALATAGRGGGLDDERHGVASRCGAGARARWEVIWDVKNPSLFLFSSQSV